MKGDHDVCLFSRTSNHRPPGEKYRVLTARITTLEGKLLAKEVELAELTEQVETQRKEAINDVSYKLEMLSQSPPARSGVRIGNG